MNQTSYDYEYETITNYYQYDQKQLYYYEYDYVYNEADSMKHHMPGMYTSDQVKGHSQNTLTARGGGGS